MLTRSRLYSLWGVGFFALLFACGGGPDKEGIGGPEVTDEDEDGFTADSDCNDNNAAIFPGAVDPCDGIDQNCDGVPDEMFDVDQDGYSTCEGDCRDRDDTSYPNHLELEDGIDNDCDGITDNHTANFDDDGDGYSENQGDCNDEDNLIGPRSVEVAVTEEGMPEGNDNDCDGEIDEAVEPCSSTGNEEDPYDYAAALDVCVQVANASWGQDLDIDERSRGIVTDYGTTYTPHAGDSMIVLSSGVVADATDPGYAGTATSFSNSISHPDPQGAVGCSSDDPTTVNDYTELKLILNVPANAKGFAFDFNFLSVEYPEWVCSSYDDTFLAILDSQAFKGNVSFDEQGNRVSVNIGFFDVCQIGQPEGSPNCVGDAELAGTGYDNGAGGGTGWLTTTAPVTPGEKATLTFMIFDEGDHTLDSAVLLDNFRWVFKDVDDPITID